MTHVLNILLADDDADLRGTIGDELGQAGHRVTLAANGAEAASLLSSTTYDGFICDVRLPKVDGVALFRRVRREAPDTSVILMTAFGGVADAVAALKEGAYDYLTKPFDIDELLVQLQRIGQQRALRQELEHARSELFGRGPEASIVGRSPQMLRVLSRIDTVAQSAAGVLITGESGTGKEMVARALHERSPRRGQPFVVVNCAAFPETLIEAELFGHERGAFTGAVRKRDGRFKAADGGTLCLDEVAEIPLPAQAKLLRVLQDGVIEPLGTNESVKVDVRILSATHRDLRAWVSEGKFREDLYYRLRVLDVEIPPLRERPSDLPALLQHFLRRFSPPGRPIPNISPRAWAALSRYRFPGNVREFAHAIEHAVVLAGGGDIDVNHLPSDISGAADGASPAFASASPGPAPSATALRSLADTLREFEHEYLRRVLHEVGGKKMRAAAILGISRKSLWEKLRRYGVAAA